jgi:hypothetical protein
MLIRRRPVLRAAAVGTVGYASYRAGKAAASQPAQEQAPSAPPPPAPPAAVQTRSDPAQRVQALTELKALLDSGAVTQEEFAQAKKSLLEAAD